MSKITYYKVGEMAYINPIPTIGDVVPDTKKEVKSNDYSEQKSIYFAFLDILGFKQAIDAGKNVPMGNGFAKKCRDVFVYYFELMQQTGMLISKPDSNNCQAGQISDSLYFYTDSEHYLVEFLKIFAHLSLYAMTQDVFFRGGIAKGCLFCRESHQFYGDCVSHAYLLESEISKNPIVLIDEDTYNAIKTLPEAENLISVSENGRYSLDPFVWLKFDLDLDIDKSLLKPIDTNKLRKVILDNKARFEYDVKNFDKYLFLSKCFAKCASTESRNTEEAST